MSRKPAPKSVPLTKRTTTTNYQPNTEVYSAFEKIDGRHPWQEKVPEGCVMYPVRRLQRTQVAYFNFSLAREMGLLPHNHPNKMNSVLEKMILKTFSLQIINEYDQAKGLRVRKDRRPPHPYMATRYLQLQHSDKTGKTSGDGRSIWNGTLRCKNVTWDISSRGTGVTCLAPGAVQAERPLKSGSTNFGYGCGTADLSELIGSAIMAEIFHINGVPTERVLTVIELGKGLGIGVRASPNLLRPAHLFLFLKQKRHQELCRATDFFIERQCHNGEWKISPESPDRFDQLLNETSSTFSRLAAQLERNYIFAWLDWDGDNVLATGGIIDYGSIRQFGLRHDQYRYDDVDRFSTNLNEQRGKARLTVQVFAQMVHYIKTGRYKSLRSFRRHPALLQFDQSFKTHLLDFFLGQVGLNENQRRIVLAEHRAAVEDLYSAFTLLEKTKSKSGKVKLPDGVNHPAVFNVRALLREMPELVLGWKNSPNEEESKRKSEPDGKNGWQLQSPDLKRVLEIMTSGFAKRADRRLGQRLREKIEAFCSRYVAVVQRACQESSPSKFLVGLAERAHEVNRPGRITGNGAEFIVEEVVKARRRGMKNHEIQQAIDLFIASQSPKGALAERRPVATSLRSRPGQLYQKLVQIAFDFEEEI